MSPGLVVLFFLFGGGGLKRVCVCVRVVYVHLQIYIYTYTYITIYIYIHVCCVLVRVCARVFLEANSLCVQTGGRIDLEGWPFSQVPNSFFFCTRSFPWGLLLWWIFPMRGLRIRIGQRVFFWDGCLKVSGYPGIHWRFGGLKA